MDSMQIEHKNIHTNNHPYQAPPYSAVDYHAAHQTGQSSLLTPVVVQPTQAVDSKDPEFQRHRQQAMCLSCQQEVITKTEHRIGCGTWFMCCLVFFLGGFGCCFIPFLMRSCKDVVHRCPVCNNVIGRKLLV